MTKLSISALAAAIAFSFAGAAAAGDKANANANANANKPMTETTAPVDTMETAKPNHGQAVSSVARSDELTTDTRGEAVSTMAHSNRDFKKLDADSDGFLSTSELNSDPDLSTAFNDWDDDADTKLSQSEYDSYIASTVTDVEEPDDEE